MAPEIIPSFHSNINFITKNKMVLSNFSEDINGKYAEIEDELNRRLENVLLQEEKINSIKEKSKLFDSYEENTTSLLKATERNENTIKVRFFPLKYKTNLKNQYRFSR